ncbi:MAG TPA: DUF1800 domain-containing protein [Pyrinomonadaceae bacterium]|nr:DUF1800 domain-containing protein [Pyrinomonadaceae bacterium]
MSDKYSLRWRAFVVRLLCASAFVLVCGVGFVAQAQAGGPVLLSEGTGTTTRGVALESVTFKSEPFPLETAIAWHADRRTRIILFAMNLDFLAGEGANALTADAEDASGKIFPLKVEYVGKVPAQEWMYQVVVRLPDDPPFVLGDVLMRINLHGVASNRVRVAIGRAGGGPPDDAGSIPTPAPAVPPAPTPTPLPKAYAAGEASNADTVRLLEQASWGPTNAEVARVQSMGLRAYLNEQFSLPASGYPNLTFPLDDQNQQCPTGTTQADCLRDHYSMYPIQRTFFTNALTAQDQLRQRVAFALHQIFVVSGAEINRPSWMTVYLQTLDRNAFGNFRQLLQEITLNPEMGEYLDMRRSTAASPNENFAREILQLFSIGVYELNPDGTPKRDATGKPLDSYNQETVNNFTRIFTGWNLSGAIGAGITNFRDPMVVRAGANHDTGSKTLLNGVVIPANQTTQKDLADALDNIFNHPNVGPFIGKQLIQHLVTSNPSPAYVGRVAAVFNNDCAGLYADGCTGTRGNLRFVVQAVLLDPEARGDAKTDPNYGKLREPVQYIANMLRAFDAKSFDKTSTSDGVLAGRVNATGGDLTAQLAQPLFVPATVFSYYQPDYEVPGARILGPAFGILTTSTTLRRANVANTLIYTGVPSTPTTTNVPRGTSLDFAPLEALAADPQQLVNALNSLLLHGTLTQAMRTSIVNAVSSVPTSDANFARKRAQMAVYLVITSSQFQVQR